MKETKMQKEAEKNGVTPAPTNGAAEAVSAKKYENPSPSGDEWFDDPENMKEVEKGIADLKAGRVRAYTMEEIRSLSGVS